MSPQEATLISRWNETRDNDDLAEIVRLYSGTVYGACLRILRNTSDAEEVTQDCFLKLAESPIKIRTSLGGLLHTMATRKSINRLRGDKRRYARETEFAESSPKDQPVSWDHVQHLVDELIIELPEHLRYVIVEHYVNGRTLESLAADLAISKQAVHKKTKAGIEKIRERLSEKGFAIAPVTLSTAFGGMPSVPAPNDVIVNVMSKTVIDKQGANVTATASSVSSSTHFSGQFIAFTVLVGALVLIAFSRLPVPFQSKQPNLDEADVQISAGASNPELESEGFVDDFSPVTHIDESESEPGTGDVIASSTAISGVVVTKESGKPLSNIEVLLTLPDRRNRYEVVERSRSNGEGAFTFPDSAIDSAFRLELGRPYKYQARLDFSTNPGVAPVILEATPQGAVHGFVRYPDGSPVQNVHINRFYSFGGKRYSLGKTDEKGKYEFPHDGGDWQFAPVGSMKYRCEPVTVHLELGQFVEEDFVMPRLSEIRLNVARPDGSVPSDFNVLQLSQHEPGSGAADDSMLMAKLFAKKNWRRDDDAFVFSLLEPGDYKFYIFNQGHEREYLGPVAIKNSPSTHKLSVVLTPRDTSAAREPFRSPVPVNGNSELLKLDILIEDADGAELSLEGTTFLFAPDRTAEIPTFPFYRPRSSVVAPGTYWFIAIKEGYVADIQLATITKESHSLSFVFGKGGTLFGESPNTNSGNVYALPLEMWEIFGEPKSMGNQDPVMAMYGEALAQGAIPDENHRFVLDFLPPGWYVLLNNFGYSDPVEVIAGYDTGPVKFKHDV